MIELPFKLSLEVMLLIKNKACAPILQMRKQPHEKGSWFSKDNSNPVNFTLISRDSHVCLHLPEMSPSLKEYVIMKVTYHGEKEKKKLKSPTYSSPQQC